jgi:hypothetical protein
MRPAATSTQAHPATADMSAASDGMRNSAATATTSATAASSGRGIGNARESGDHGGNGENLDV